MSQWPRSVVVAAELQSLPEVMDLVGGAVTFAELSAERGDHVTLAVEEAFVNVCRHAYGDRIGEVELRAWAAAHEVVVEICDSGLEFNPLEAATPDPMAPLESRRDGGMGLVLLRSVTDALTYRRDGGRNVLRIVVRGASD